MATALHSCAAISTTCWAAPVVTAATGDGSASITFPTPIAVAASDVIEVVGYFSTQTAGDASAGVFLTGSNGEAEVPFSPTGFNYISASLTGADVGALFTGFRMLGGNGDLAGVAKISINGKVLLDPGARGLGDTTASLPTLNASATTVVGASGDTLTVSGISGPWRPNLHIKGASISSSAPSPESIVFTSMNGGTTEVTGTDATLKERIWYLEQSSSQAGPWSPIGDFYDYSANDSQDGATPWAGKPELLPNTYYKVKVKYTSDNAVPIESVFNTFKTGDA